MKRAVCLSAVLLLTLTACSDDDPASSTASVETSDTTPPATASGADDPATTPTTDRTDDTATATTTETDPDATATFEPVACFPTAGLTDGVDIRCGTVTVPMGGAGTADVSLHVTVIGTTDTVDGARGALMHLPGGPGASAESYAPVLGTTYLPLSEAIGKPIVFVDQRGTGLSTPFLTCDDLTAPAACVEAWEADGIDPVTFSTPFAADDLVAVADALGVEQIDLWGASYGSRLALETVRRHGERVRSLTIESIDTAASPLDDALDVRAALERAGDECNADPTCAAVLPDLVTTFDDTAAALPAEPFVTALGEVTADSFVTTTSELMQWARGTSYVPAWVAAVRDRDAATTEAIQLAVAQAPFPGGQFSEAMFQLVNCLDLAPFDPVATIDALGIADDDLLGQVRAAGDRATYGDACTGWPTDPDAPVDPVTSDVPALVIAGAIDSNTPLENAELAAGTLSSATVVTFPSTGHFPAHQGGNPCALTILAAFLADPTAELDTSCVPAPATVTVMASPAAATADTAVTTAVPTLGLAADLPQGWLSLDGATYATAGAALQLTLVPGTVDEIATGLAEQLGLDPASAVEQTLAGSPWTQLTGEVEGSLTTALFTQADTSVLVVLVSTEDGTDPTTIAVGVVESIVPL